MLCVHLCLTFSPLAGKTAANVGEVAGQTNRSGDGGGGIARQANWQRNATLNPIRIGGKIPTLRQHHRKESDHHGYSQR
jgi:hypothetical protein